MVLEIIHQMKRTTNSLLENHCVQATCQHKDLGQTKSLYGFYARQVPSANSLYVLEPKTCHLLPLLVSKCNVYIVSKIFWHWPSILFVQLVLRVETSGVSGALCSIGSFDNYALYCIGNNWYLFLLTIHRTVLPWRNAAYACFYVHRDEEQINICSWAGKQSFKRYFWLLFTYWSCGKWKCLAFFRSFKEAVTQLLHD